MTRFLQTGKREDGIMSLDIAVAIEIQTAERRYIFDGIFGRVLIIFREF